MPITLATWEIGKNMEFEASLGNFPSQNKKGWGCSSVAECLSSMYEAVGFIFNTIRKRKVTAVECSSMVEHLPDTCEVLSSIPSLASNK